MKKSLTESAKKAIVEKALNRADKTLTEIATQNNIACSTLSKWIRIGLWTNRLRSLINTLFNFLNFPLKIFDFQA